MSKEQANTKNKKETQDKELPTTAAEHERMHDLNTPSEKTESDEEEEFDDSIEEEVEADQENGQRNTKGDYTNEQKTPRTNHNTSQH